MLVAPGPFCAPRSTFCENSYAQWIGVRLASDHAWTALVRFDTVNSEIGLLVDPHSCGLQINQRSSGGQT